MDPLHVNYIKISIFWVFFLFESFLLPRQFPKFFTWRAQKTTANWNCGLVIWLFLTICSARNVENVGQGDPGAGRGEDPPHVGEGGGRGLPTDCTGVSANSYVHLQMILHCMNYSIIPIIYEFVWVPNFNMTFSWCSLACSVFPDPIKGTIGAKKWWLYKQWFYVQLPVIYERHYICFQFT